MSTRFSEITPSPGFAIGMCIMKYHCLVSILVLAFVAPAFADQTVLMVTDDASLRAALREARPGTHIRIAPGRYLPEVRVDNLKGTEREPIIIEGAKENDPPRFEGGIVAWFLTDCAFLVLRNIDVRRQSQNGINIDDAGTFDTPAHHIKLEKVRVADTGPDGNFHGIKLSGVDDFVIRDCLVEGWGGSAIAMVGCHRGVIEGCTFRGKEGFSQNLGLQAKGGSSQIVIRRSFFQNAGARAVQLGGSTGSAYFRPRGALYEAKDIQVQGCTLAGSEATVSFVGIDGGVFDYNTVYRPNKWVIWIHQENTAPGFAPCRNGRFEHNLVVFRRANIDAFVKIGQHTEPKTFTFAHNLWFCEDRPEASKPQLPTTEADSLYGVDPRLVAPERNQFMPQNPKAAAFGASAWKPAILLGK